MADKNRKKDGSTVVVLGAGATRACSFVAPAVASCIPPLDADFFTQLQRVPDEKHQEDIGAVMQDVVKLFGSNFTVTLETVFATIEHTIRMLQTTGAKRQYEPEELKKMKDRLLGAIAIAMEASLAERAPEGHARQSAKPCEHHEKLVEHVLRSQDAIISFNYDCVIDYALKAKGNGIWNAKYGYGFKGQNLTGDDVWQPEQPASASDSLGLHKLHGSMNFRFKGSNSSPVYLKQRPYTKQRGTPRYSIIPPESNKAYDKGIYAQLWKNAAAAIGRAEHIILIGYSLPITDLHATALFRTSIERASLKSLVIVNPDQDARSRTRSTLQRGLSSSTRVLSFDSVPEFLATDVSAWRAT